MGEVIELFGGPDPSSAHEGCQLIVEVNTQSMWVAQVVDGMVWFDPEPGWEIRELSARCPKHNRDVCLENMEWGDGVE